MTIAGSGYTAFGGGYDGPGIDPSGVPPVLWWTGLDGPSGRPIGPHGPFATTAPAAAVVTRATSLITSPITAAPFRCLSGGQYGVPIPRPTWLSDPCLLRPDGRITDTVLNNVAQLPRSEFWASWIRAACWTGVGAIWAQLDTAGEPLAGTMRLLDPATLSVERDSGGGLRWVLGDPADSDRLVFNRDGTTFLGGKQYRLIILRNPHSPVVDGRSMGVFEMSPGAFNLSDQIASYAAGTFRSGIPAGFLKVESPPNLTREQADELRAAWLRHHGGDRRSIAVLNAFTTFEPIQMSPVDAALGEMTRLGIADVAYAFGLSPENLGVSLSGSATYANVRDHFQDLKDMGISAWVSAVQDVLSALLPGSAGVVVNTDGFASPPMSERVSTGRMAVEAGLMTVDEWRASEGLPPMPKPVQPPQLSVVPDEQDPPEPEEPRARPPALRR